MKRVLLFLSLLLVISQFGSVSVFSQEEESEEFPYPIIDWEGIVEFDGIANIYLPAGYSFVGKEGTISLMDYMRNSPTGLEVGFIEPDSGEWFVLFEFENIGYVPDDEKDDLDADVLLEGIKLGTEQANKERAAAGVATIHSLHWYEEPFYDYETNNLKWAIEATDSDNSVFVNYNVRVLGRYGVTSITLITGTANLPYHLPLFNNLISTYAYLPGSSYAEYQEGDLMYEYGMTALITGGAAAVAAKTGVFKWLWKVILVAFGAIGGFFKKLFGKKEK